MRMLHDVPAPKKKAMGLSWSAKWLRSSSSVLTGSCVRLDIAIEQFASAGMFRGRVACGCMLRSPRGIACGCGARRAGASHDDAHPARQIQIPKGLGQFGLKTLNPLGADGR